MNLFSWKSTCDATNSSTELKKGITYNKGGVFLFTLKWNINSSEIGKKNKSFKTSRYHFKNSFSAYLHECMAPASIQSVPNVTDLLKAHLQIRNNLQVGKTYVTSFHLQVWWRQSTPFWLLRIHSWRPLMPLRRTC